MKGKFLGLILFVGLLISLSFVSGESSLTFKSEPECNISELQEVWGSTPRERLIYAPETDHYPPEGTFNDRCNEIENTCWANHFVDWNVCWCDRDYVWNGSSTLFGSSGSCAFSGELPIIDNDGDGHIEDEDCDDNDPLKWKIHTEVYFDTDGDGYGQGTSFELCAGDSLPEGYSDEGGDCVDSLGDGELINPGMPEVCSDEVDNDCDDEINEGCVAGAYWYDLKGENIIGEADLNDWVMMKTQGLFVEGILKYAIRKLSSPLDIFELFTSEVGDFDSSTEDYVLWKANESGEYFFRVGLRGEEFAETSMRSEENLEVSDVESDDSPVEVIINSPSCGINVTKGSLVNVVVEISDEDDLVRGNVSFGDGSEEVEVINGVTEINHTYNVGGDMKILVDVENDRGAVKRAVTNIMVVDESIDGIYSAACITSPDNFGFYSQASVPFDARDSRGIIYTASSGNYDVFGAGDDRLMFNWTINEGEDDEEMRNGYDFNLLFPTAGRKTVKLDVNVV
jgi:hypothetical protein